MNSYTYIEISTLITIKKSFLANAFVTHIYFTHCSK